jgi:23S rRNA (guanine745-N1)-methyltransferase
MSTASGAPALAVLAALRRIAEFLVCPVCGEPLEPGRGGLRCASRHSFDRARQGYVSLLTGDAATGMGDTAEMTAARAEFLEAGHFAPVAAMLAAQAARFAADGLVVDAGAGTGYYLRNVLDRLPGAVGLALDISKAALRRAARAHRRAGAVGWDIRQPFPIRPRVASLVLDVFAPRNGAEFRRILRPDGALLVVTPTAGHLAGLAGVGLLSVDSRKDARMERSLSPHFRLERRDEQTLPLRLPRTQVAALVRMGPSAHHLPREEIERRVTALAEPVAVTAGFAVSVYRPR